MQQIMNKVCLFHQRLMIIVPLDVNNTDTRCEKVPDRDLGHREVEALQSNVKL